MSGTITLACNQFLQKIDVTVAAVKGSPGTYTLTGMFRKGYPAGCFVAQKGSQGVVDLVADRISPDYKTSYYGIATDSSHMNIVYYVLGVRQPIPSWKHNFGLNVANNLSINRHDKVSQACNFVNVGASTFSAKHIHVTGSGVGGDVSGDFLANTITGSGSTACIFWPDPRADTTAAVTGSYMGVASATVSRASGISKACNVPNGPLYSGQNIHVVGSGAGGDVSGDFTANTLDTAGCISWPDSRADTTTAIANVYLGVGGIDTGATGNGGYALYDAAEILQVGSAKTVDSVTGNVTAITDGSFDLGPNTIKWSTGNRAVSLFDMSSKTIPLRGCLKSVMSVHDGSA